MKPRPAVAAISPVGAPSVHATYWETAAVTDNWLFWAILSAAFAAATAVLSKIGVRDVDADVGQLVRTAIVLAAVGALVAASGRWRELTLVRSQTWFYLVLAGLATAASWVCYFRALKVGEVARVASVDRLSVPMVAVIAVLALGERLGAVGWLGVLLATAGTVLVSIAK
jgi:transporter family protein